MTPLVDIILLNHNTWRHTIECLESVMRSDYPAFRVIISDNHSTDDSLARIRGWLSGAEQRIAIEDVPPRLREYVAPPVPKPIPFVEGDAGAPFETGDAPVVIVRLPRNAGFAGGNNAALALSMREGRAGFAWILNNDTVVAPDCLRHLVAAATADPRSGVVGVTVMEYLEPETVQLASGGMASPTTGTILQTNQAGVPIAALDRNTTTYNFVSCCSALARREALEKTGLLDERFFIYGEDGDFSLRMARDGWRLGYAPDAMIWHKGSQTTVRGSVFNDYHQVRSSLLFVHKWHRRRVPTAFAFMLYRALAPKLLRRQWSRASAVLRAFSDVVREIRAA